MNQRILFYYEVAVNAPINKTFTYSSSVILPLGQFIVVPFGKRQLDGCIIKKNDETNAGFEVKSILEVKSEPCLPEKYLLWAKWMSDYYQFPLGQILKLFLPPLKKAIDKKQLVKKSPLICTSYQKKIVCEFTKDQHTVISDINQNLESFAVHLLHGVTGSGKTEVYIELAKKVIQSGKRVLFLIPEISLTPQLINRFNQHFEDQLAIIHSHLTAREKTNQWWSMLDKNKKILLGARSALFCPIEDLGLILIDEEHESSYKQDEKLKYHARDISIYLAKLFDIPIILGSATPSLETWFHAKSKKYRYHSMLKRVNDVSLPSIEIIDMSNNQKNVSAESQHPYWLSPKLLQELELNLNQQKQSALFLNKRGFSSIIICHDCGYVSECPNCSISLTLHGKNHLVCHYCGFSDPFLETCPSCKQGELKALGVGTERVHEDLKKIFPDARIARADRDEIQNRNDIESLISDMEQHKIDILIGTQMIAKGLDFPKLSLVGLIMADVGLHLPDFRASEKTFQLITQVSGRAGRDKNSPGKVILQTYDPTNSTILFAKQMDFESFYSSELQQRNDLFYPPFSRMARIRIEGVDSKDIEGLCEKIDLRVAKLSELYSEFNQLIVLGPSPSPINKIKRKYRYHLLIKSPQSQWLKAYIKALLFDLDKKNSRTKILIDIDPINML